MILTGKQPEEEPQPVESVKLETGTRLGTVKLIVDGKTTDNIPIKGLIHKGILGNLNDKYAAKDHKHKEYLKPSEVDIVGNGTDGEVEFTEAVSPDTTNGILTLKMKEGQEFQRIIDLPFTGLKHLAFADKLTAYPDEMDASFYNDMCVDLNRDLEFVSTTRSSTITGGSLTIQSSGGVGGNLTCEDITADDITASGDATVTGDISANDISVTGAITAAGNISSTGGNISADGTITADGNITGAGFVVPNGTSSQYLKADGSVDDSITADRLPYSMASVGTNTAGWVEFARADIAKTSSQATVFVAQHNMGASFIVSSYYRRGDGIINLSYRKEANATSPNTTYTYIRKACGDGSLAVDKIKMVIQYDYPSTGYTRVSLYYNAASRSPLRFTKIDEGSYTVKTTNWVMLNTTDSYQTGGNLPTESSTCIWVDCTDDSYAATAGNVSGKPFQFTGTCDTAAATAAKEATVGSSFALIDGVIVTIKYTNSNTYTGAAGDITLNVNGTGAKQIYYNSVLQGATANTIANGLAGRYITYIYDATNQVWVWMSVGYAYYVNTYMRVYRQTSGYNDDYPLIASRTKTIGTAGSNGTYSDVYGVIFNTNYPTVNPSTGKVKVKALAVNGVDITGNSDERLKDIQGNVNISIEDIANAPSILYKKKDSDDEKVHLGSIAQYWEKIASWAVGEDNDGMLTLDYPALSLAASIQCAREIVDLKKRIEKLEEKLL